MSYEGQVEFLKEYNVWVMAQKAKGMDLTPDAFMLDRAKEQALDQLIRIEERIQDPDHPDELAQDIADIIGVDLE